MADIWKDQEKIVRYVSSSECSSFAKRQCIVREANFFLVDRLAMSSNNALKEHQFLGQLYKSSTPS